MFLWWFVIWSSWCCFWCLFWGLFWWFGGCLLCWLGWRGCCWWRGWMLGRRWWWSWFLLSGEVCFCLNGCNGWIMIVGWVVLFCCRCWCSFLCWGIGWGLFGFCLDFWISVFVCICWGIFLGECWWCLVVVVWMWLWIVGWWCSVVGCVCVNVWWVFCCWCSLFLGCLWVWVVCGGLLLFFLWLCMFCGFWILWRKFLLIVGVWKCMLWLLLCYCVGVCLGRRLFWCCSVLGCDIFVFLWMCSVLVSLVVVFCRKWWFVFGGNGYVCWWSLVWLICFCNVWWVYLMVMWFVSF